MLSSVKHGFTENKGQIRDQAGHPAANIRYLLQMNGLNVQLRKGGFSYDAYVKNKQGETQVMQFHRVDIDLVGADLNAALISSDQVPGSTMNVIGDNGGYQVNEFGKVTYRDIYPGIDLEFIARATEDKPVEYNFIVHPGADASRIRMKYHNGSDIALVNGQIEMKLAFGIAVDKANSRIYVVGHTQDDIGIATSGAFQETRNGFLTEGFLVQLNMNGERTWGTYLSTTYTGQMVAEDVKTDALGNAYVLGYVSPTSATYSGNATECSFKSVTGSASADIFINKFNAGGARVWGTLYGSLGSEDVSSTRTIASYHTTFAVDAKGNVYAGARTLEIGSTMSTAGSFQPVNKGGNEGILVKFTEGYLPTDFKVAASTIAPLTQNACALGVPQTIIGNSINGTNPPEFSTGIFYQWQTAASATGPWTDLTGEVFKDLTPPTGSSNAYFRRLVKANNGYCDLATVDSSAAALVNITGNVAPTANANGPQWFLCSGNTVTLNGSATAVSPATISSYQWFAGNATTASAATATYVTSAITAATTYTLKVTDNNGCVALDQVNVIPVTADAGADANFCQGSTGVMIGSTPVSSNRQCVTGSGCGLIDIAVLSAQQCPKVFANTPLLLGVKNIATADYNFSWSPANMVDNPTAATVNVTSTAQGTITVVVTNKYDPSITCTDNIVVNPAAWSLPVVNVSDKNTCPGTPVSIGTTNVAGYNYVWSPATGLNNVNASNPTATLSSSAGASQTFTVTVSDPVSGCTLVDNVTLSGTVAAGSYAGPAAGPSCAGIPAQLGVASAPGASYLWTPATGLSATNVSNPIATPSTTTTYTVAVSYPGCNTALTDQVTVSVLPVTTFDFTDKTICPGTPVNIGVGGTGNPASIANAASYSWTPATGLSCTNCASPNASPQTLTTYTCTVTFANGCKAQDNVTVTPTFAASAKPDAVICSGGSVVLGQAAVANVTYSWTPATGLSSATVAQPTASPSATTDYTLTATGTGVNAGCVITDAVRVTVNVPTPFTITGNASLCAGGNTTIGFTPANANMLYQWSPLTGVASPNQSSTMVTPAGTQVYRLVQTDLATGCSNYQQIKVTVLPNTITANADTTKTCVNNGVALPLAVTSAGTYTYSWLPASFLSDPFAKNPTTYASNTTTYTATITDNTSNCQLLVNAPLVTDVCFMAVSGNVFHDANGQSDNTVNSTAATGNLPTGMYVSLVDASNKIIATVAVQPDGTYKFENVPQGTYSLVLTNDPAGAVTPVTPAGWHSTGAHLGTGPGTSGNGGTLPNITVGTEDVTNANIAIQQPPVADPKTHIIATPVGKSSLPLTGTGAVNAPGPLSGTDPEDGIKGSGATFTITDLSKMNVGGLLYQGTIAEGVTSQKLTLNSLAAGVYVVYIQGADINEQVRLLLN
ncbi:hypothetical protein OSTOST_09796 [Ostertagia ostertagi]